MNQQHKHASHAKSVSVIICAYTEARWKDLIAAVASVQAQCVAAHETIVVIDHNRTLYERVQRHPIFVNMVVIENEEQPGLSGARNSGVRVARSEIVAFLDDDAVAAPDWIEQFLAGYTTPEIVGVGGAIMPIWDDGRPAWFPEEFDWVVGCTYRGLPSMPTHVRNLIGANMSFRREVVVALGGFRSGIGRVSSMPLGCEETEFCIRAHQYWRNTTIAYVPNARVQHRVPAERGRWSYFRARCYAEGISKARVSRFVGTNDGLASEVGYVLQILPRGIFEGLKQGLGGNLSGFHQAGAMLVGLAITTVGYLRGKLFSHRPLMLHTSLSECLYEVPQ